MKDWNDIFILAFVVQKLAYLIFDVWFYGTICVSSIDSINTFDFFDETIEWISIFDISLCEAFDWLNVGEEKTSWGIVCAWAYFLIACDDISNFFAFV